MGPEEFKRLYLGEFTWSEKDQKLYDIGKYYHETCETYDRKICTGPIKHGSVQPGRHYELVDINKHASGVYRQCVAIGIRAGFTEKEIAKAVKEYRTRYGG